MLKDQDIICISSIDWDFIWQGHQEIMSTLATNGNRILFIENTGVRSPNLKDLPRLKKRVVNWLKSVKGIRQERENLYIYSPIILPFPYSRIARFINKGLVISALRRWVKTLGFSNPILWTFLPTGLVLDIVNSIDNKLLIYYCIDNFEASSKQAARIVRTEGSVIRRSDLVFVTAKNLYDKCIKFNKEVHIFPYGVNMEIYEKAKGRGSLSPKDLDAISRPIIGYVGGIHKWIDFELVKFLAKSNLDKSFVFIGPFQRDVSELKEMPNIYFLGQKRYEELPSYVLQFDVCTIPYVIAEYTKNVYPTKINEYLSLGKPVVSTAIPEVEAYNKRNDGIIMIGNTYEKFADNINRALKEKTAPDVYKTRIDTAEREGSWKDKIEKMSDLIEGKLAEKEDQRSLHWKENLLKFYKASERKFAFTLATLVILYFILFHTPFIWMVGKPLKISAPLEKADAILVLAGGVGESGRAGQGYEERVQYGVDLYKKGYAPRLIFSSGFQYAIKEADIMKALAISLGVPERSIILEDNAANTYENIKFSSDILRQHRWKKIILVSSPYNMLRASLVCKKIASDLNFIYTPIQNSLFYGQEGHVQQKHINAILHEYLGILYYRVKGYI